MRLVWAFAEGLDLGPLYAAIKAVEGHAGHPPADPRMLMALWLNATIDGIGSARHLARLCEEHRTHPARTTDGSVYFWSRSSRSGCDDVMDLSLCGVAFLWESSPASKPQ